VNTSPASFFCLLSPFSCLLSSDYFCPMQVDYLLIGQGISGTWLSYFLSGAGASFIVLDDASAKAPSRVAAGIINPVTGRRIVRSWRTEEFLPFAANQYAAFGAALGITAVSEKKVIDFFPTPQMKLAFEDRFAEGESFLQKPGDENDWAETFHYHFGYGIVSPCFTVHLAELLRSWRKQLAAKGQLKEEKFDSNLLKVHPDFIQYENITAAKIIFCDGNAAGQSVYFERLPFARNKGEALILEIQDLPGGFIFKKGLMLTPLPQSGLFWLGSSNTWDYADDAPTSAWKEQSENLLRSWLKLPYKILDHKAALRPATVERRPFVGIHPLYPSIGLLNGMGTKGCSLAPWFAKELADHLLCGKAITPEADIKRFTKILSR
jgi:glycine/D-amino acid oxidase-like deaminating enzyme